MRRTHQPRHSDQAEGSYRPTSVLPGRHAAPSALRGRRWQLVATAAALTLVILVLIVAFGRQRETDRPDAPTPLPIPGSAEPSLGPGSPTGASSVPNTSRSATAAEPGGDGGPGVPGQPRGRPTHPAAPTHKPKPSRPVAPSRSPRPHVGRMADAAAQPERHAEWSSGLRANGLTIC